MSNTILKEKELRDLMRFRIERFLELGFSEDEASLLAGSDIDYRDAQALVERGCSVVLALQILL